MSSPFKKSFLAKSPLSASPFNKGGYASGVDGMQYVSPKQPEPSKLPASKLKKEEPVEELPTEEKIVERRGYGVQEDNDFSDEGTSSVETRVVEEIDPGKESELKGSFKTIWGRMGSKEKAKHKNDFNVFKTAGLEYIKNYEIKHGKGSWRARGKTADTIYNQNQQRTTVNDKVGEWVNIGERYLKES